MHSSARLQTVNERLSSGVEHCRLGMARLYIEWLRRTVEGVVRVANLKLVNPARGRFFRLGRWYATVDRDMPCNLLHGSMLRQYFKRTSAFCQTETER